LHDELFGKTEGLEEVEVAILQVLQDSLFVFDPLNRGHETWDTSEQIVEKLKRLEPIKNPSDIFRTHLTSDDQVALTELAANLNTSIESAVGNAWHTPNQPKHAPPRKHTHPTETHPTAFNTSHDLLRLWALSDTL